MRRFGVCACVISDDAPLMRVVFIRTVQIGSPTMAIILLIRGLRMRPDLNWNPRNLFLNQCMHVGQRQKGDGRWYELLNSAANN
jgi:hypothetical protein